MKYSAVISVSIILLLLVSCGETELPPGGSGLIEATEIIVSAETMGQLKALHFAGGDRIKKGDTIGLIDTITIILRLRQAAAMKQAAQTKLEIASINVEQASYNLDLAQKEFDRIGSLLESGSANQQQYDKVENAYHQALLARKQALAAMRSAKADLARIDAEIALLEEQYNDCFPTAPASGRIIDKYVDVGELVGTGKSLIKIGKLDTVWVKVYLPPTDLTRITLGDRAEIDPEDGRETPIIGYISWIASEAEFTPKNVQTKEARADLVYAVKITIPNPEERLKIGMPVYARIL